MSAMDTSIKLFLLNVLDSLPQNGIVFRCDITGWVLGCSHGMLEEETKVRREVL